jgi:CubicO group peptidase (beta-lactamase class C family)
MKVANIPGVGTCKLEALKTPLVADPGDKWEYGINIDWAGKAVERVSGLSLDGYLRDRIFTPLGMKDTVFILKPDQQARVASVHARGADGKLTPAEFAMPQAPEFFMGGGGIYSTGRDYLTFLRALLAGGRLNNAQILKPETVALMNKNNMGDLNVTLLKTAQPDLTNDAEFFPGMVKKWGLAYMINTQDVPGAAQRRQPGVGRPRQHLLLARSEEEGDRRYPDPNSALRRSEGPAVAGRLRDRRLPERPRGVRPACRGAPRRGGPGEDPIPFDRNML